MKKTISELFRLFAKTPANDLEHTILGRVCKPVSKSSKDTFVRLTDSSTTRPLQLVIDGTDFYARIKPDDCLKVTGRLTASKGLQQPLELHVNQIISHFVSDRLYKSEDFERLKSTKPISIVRSNLIAHIHQYLTTNQFTLIATPILTNVCEGEDPDEVFELNQLGYFSNTNSVFLTPSAQLHLELAASALCSNVYTIGPVFRADKCVSRHHLSEFHMLELELVDVASLNDLMDCCENLIRSCIEHILKTNRAELEHLKALENLEKTMTATKFTRITYDDALAAIGISAKTTANYVLNKFAENAIVEKCGNNRPVFLTNFPRHQKPFYMRTIGDRADCFDLLAANSGEIAGGSLRETGEMELPAKNRIEWYADLRRSGYPNLGGFGIGIERLLMTMLGLGSAKQSLPFPRFKNKCRL